MSNELTRGVCGTCACSNVACIVRCKYKCYRLLNYIMKPFVYKTNLTECTRWSRIFEPLFCAVSLKKIRKLVFIISHTLVLVTRCFLTNNCCGDSCLLYHLTYIR
jgi:hypothetical protein